MDLYPLVVLSKGRALARCGVLKDVGWCSGISIGCMWVTLSERFQGLRVALLSLQWPVESHLTRMSGCAVFLSSLIHACTLLKY